MRIETNTNLIATLGKIFIYLFIFPLLLLFALLYFVFVYPIIFAYGQWFKFRFWRRHGIHGTCVLFVYSDSPNWKDYIEANALPRIGSHSVILNWSKRREWVRTNPFEAKVFYHWAGKREFNPIAIIFSPDGNVRVVRFWQAFRDFKHGNGSALQVVERELFNAVETVN